MASRTCFLVASVHSTSGRRSLALAWPTSSAPYFTGAGLVSTNSALCSGIRRSWISNTLSRSRFFQASCMSPQSRGAMLAVTEMQPSPPWAMKPTALASSPESCRKPFLALSLVSVGRAMS